MDDELIRIDCENCGGRIKFPASMAGNNAACPHCDRPLVLSSPVVSAVRHESGVSKWKVIGISALVFAIVAGIVVTVVFKRSKDKNDRQTVETVGVVASKAVETAQQAPPDNEAVREVVRDLDSVVGDFNRLPVENPWHEGVIVARDDRGKRIFEWSNKAGVRWNLLPTGDSTILKTGPGNPYLKNGLGEFRLEYQGERVIGFEFNGEFYVRKGVKRLTQRTGGLKGYINMSVPRPPNGFQFGASFYVAIWPLIDQPMLGFQIGLPSTWIIPSNRDFKQPLVPPNVPAFQWKERAGNHFHDVFQTIEGGLGYWGSTRFGSVVPKYRINGTPNGYAHEISTPGWGFGNTTALTPPQMGIAQLSNRLLLPPDGLTFASLSAGELLGNAWMALPLVPARQDAKVPIGNQSWTLFLRSANFEGAVAFYVPDIWSRMSESYSIIQRRGLDARPGEMGSGAMEVNTVPYFEASDDKGNTYSKIPRLQFPVADNGITVLMQDITLYSGVALFQPMYRHLFQTGGPVNGFELRGAWKPDCTANPIIFKQGGGDIPLEGFESHVKTITFGQGTKNSFGLQWTQARGTGTLPQYFRQSGNRRVAIGAPEAPDDLRSAGFRPARDTQSYTSPSGKNTVWSRRGPASVILKAKLTDGSTVTYAWYRFIDQPSVVAQNWPEENRNQVQKLIEKLHAQWSSSALSMPPPTSGTLCTLDEALLVTPPKGMEQGYVPIALRQARE